MREYNKAFNSTQGDGKAKTMAGIKAVLKMFQGAIKLYIDNSNNGTNVKEVK